MSIDDIEIMVSYFKDKGKIDGLDYKDYRELTKIENRLKNIDITNDYRLRNINREVKSMLRTMLESGMFREYKWDNKYIENNSFILPLVIANSTDEDYHFSKDNKVRFHCQFEKSSSKSMYVKDIDNYLHCQKCHISYHAIPYLKRIEKISNKEAIILLCKIYNFYIPIQNKKLDLLACKYKRIIASSEYINLSKEGYIKLKEDNVSEINGLNVENEYLKRFKTIERISSLGYDKDFQVDESPKKVLLK